MWEITFYRHLVNDCGRLGKVALDRISIEQARDAIEARALAVACFERKHGKQCWDQLAHELSVSEVPPLSASGCREYHETARL